MPRLKQWIPSEEAMTCLDCGIAFSFLVRRHHCRLCGRVFCSTCSNQENLIPEVLLEEIPASPETSSWWASKSSKKRLCHGCYCRTISIQQVEPQMLVLMLLTEHTSIDMRDWCLLRCVNIGWKSTIDHLMTLLRNARQKGIPNTTFTDIEMRLIRMHHTSLARHSAWQLTVKEAALHPSNIPCAWLGCQCTAYIPVAHAIEIILNLSTPSLYTRAVDSLIANVDDLGPFMPILCYATLRKSTFFSDFFLQFLDHPVFVHRMAFSAKAIGNDALFQRILHHVSEPLQLELIEAVSFSNLLMELSKDVTGEGRRRSFEQWRKSVKPHVRIMIPGQADWQLEEIRLNEIRRFQSSTKPTIVPCVCRNQQSHRLGLITLLIKEEPVLKDLCVINCLSAIDILSNFDFPIITYHVQPLTLTSGMIVVVSNATTLFEISNKKRISIQNYLLEKNKHVNVEALRLKFVKSAAVTCVLSHVIGVGDRHLDNLMVTDDGALFNIDFGYIFRQEVFHRKVSESSMKITPEILDALGGENSLYFQIFKEKTTYLYNLMRQHVKSMYYVFVPLVLCKIMKKEDLVQHMEKYLVPDCTQKEATIKIEDCIRSNTFNTKWDRLLDTVHFVKKTWLDQ